MSYKAKNAGGNFSPVGEKMWEALSKRYLDIEHVGIIYITYVVFLASCYIFRKCFSNKFIHFVNVFKGLLVTLISLVSLKYVDLNITLGINLLHVYNITQLCTFLESLWTNKKKTNEKSTSQENRVVHKYEISKENENEYRNEYELIGDTSKHLEQLAKKILKNEKSIKENEGILKEKEIIEEIEKKEKEEEEYMKKKNTHDSQKKKDRSASNSIWIYFFFSQTFYIFFYFFFWKYIHNIMIIKVYLTLQLSKSLISLASNFYHNNTNINLFKRINHALSIVYMIWVSLFFTKILYTSNDNSKLIHNFSVLSILFHAYYVYVVFVNYIYTYHKQFRSSLFSFILFFHIFGVIGMIKLYYHDYGRSLFAQCIIFYLINGFGITFGAHRLWSHRAFKAGTFVQVLFLILNSFANQGSVITWSKNHRLHHKYSDTKYDPHNIRYGFFYSHVGWLLYQKTKYVKEKEKEIYVDDLLQNPLLLWQHKLDPYFNFFFCFIVPGIYSYYMYNNFWDGFFILGALRWIITLHATWSINSASHSFGHRPYNNDIKASNNIFTSIVALGEGCHNYHHVFPYCYAMNENFYILSINPTKYVIQFFYHLGLVWDLKCAQNICKEVRLKEAEKLEKKNKLLSENIKNEIMKKEDTSYVTDLMNSLTALCNDYINISTFRYITYLLRDFAIMMTILLIQVYYCYNKYGNGTLFSNMSKNFEGIESNKLISVSSFVFFHIILYALPMGTMFASLYSLVYECKRGLLFKNQFLNNFFGSIISSFILLPYTSENSRKSLLISLNEDFLKVLKGPIYFDLYSFIFTIFLGLYGLAIYIFGHFYFLIFFIAPYVVFNAWLLTYIYLLNNPPFFTVDMNAKDVDISVLNYVVFQSLLEWKKNNSIYQSKKRLYKMVFFFLNFIHHHLCYTHIVEFINSKIPSYRTKEIYKQFDKTLDQYHSLRNDKFIEILKQFL
ncbi:stearoyl-CoA desaturase, putative [Plasmodium knowlesi strain H]|uniref:Stearoyl-CoA desaturase, putative n=3 Tax=Plasmodium knowlesi TaxID=5850 RepID=A0A5K1TYI9_PLAKH|nr:stearoyl-CoA desaturase, putative [Plasmodium knowlesi strain H]OTN66916.1 putative Stearoyl-CoA desaturase (Acyl-CoA desaturase - faty acid desaturase) [Plasmodium knowlesi]CAA9988730.1 stearoyl-CoA desaturase, putative [Plasmodium knowlesi strain H]SBO21680.1 stearoyl-CoA desaturase, putative [Plasmodium knowlesi strain H]SBO22044.1 stearoyl-CoA desaturase, putative [Plasmodium knowlesi strain H]VVS78204.1 stearoyl-CoA desaturase, putative [Plasmodium knowlesi strain H]|eukprot:XP_002259705.1 stearoyl-CoA desaturase (acyl-CoA desaturase,faty acid desaturase), putative [Plasmodium knowlesi strain H]